MVIEVILPKLGQTMEEGTIIEWVKQEGDRVERGEVLFSAETDKATLEVEATSKGYLRKILVPVEQTVQVLTVVGLMTRKADESIEDYQVKGESLAAEQKEAVATGLVSEPILQESSQPGRKIFASPRARMTAREKGVNLASVAGSGLNGRIVEQDVLSFVPSSPKATPVAVKTAEKLSVDLSTLRGTGRGGLITKEDVIATAELNAKSASQPSEAAGIDAVPMTTLRRIIAERMLASSTSTAPVNLVTEVDATLFVESRDSINISAGEEWGLKLGYNELLGFIVARVLTEFPYMNARLSDEGQVIEQLTQINLGMAVDTERGLLVPVIRNADRKGLHAFGTEYHKLVERALEGKSLPDDLSGGTFTITNLGMFDIDAFTPIINLPEVAILGVGRIQPKAVPRGSEIAVRQMWTLTLTFDHRLVDGAPAARFLQRVKQIVENPFHLLTEVNTLS